MQIQGISDSIPPLPPVKPRRHQWKKGEVANPKGKPPGNQDFIVRAKYLIGKYDLGQMLDITADPKQLRKLSAFDATILQRCVEMASPGGRKSMGDLLDRLLGKPAQYIAVDSNNTQTLVIQRALGEARELDTETLLLIKAQLEKKEPLLIENSGPVETQ